MMKLKSFAAGLVLAALSLAPAFAQGVGQIGAGQVLGNSTATQARAAPTALSPLFNRGFCSTANASLARISGTWVCITYSGELSFTGTVLGVTANGITNAMLRQSVALSLIGRSANSTGNAADIQATAASDAVLRESGSTIGFGQIATNGISNNAVTNAKLATAAANTVKANATGGSAAPTDVTAPTARSSSLLNIDNCTSTGDANYVILATDRCVYHTALSAARTDTLPAANAVNNGQWLFITDLRAVVTAVNTITLSRAGADTVNGGTTFTTLTVASGIAACVSDGSSRWNCAVWGSSGGSGVTSLTPGGGMVSSTTAACSQTAITTSGTLSQAQCINAQTGTSYAIVDGDRGKLITATNAAAQAYTIAQAGAASNFSSGWFVDIQNNSTNPAGIVTITATTSVFKINGFTSSTLAINPGQNVRLVSDGTDYVVFNNGLSVPPLQANPTNPTGTASATRLMMGMGATCSFTPKYSTRVQVFFQGTAINTGNGNGIGFAVRFGTGSAPANAAAETGTAVATPIVILETAASGSVAFGGLGGNVTGLTPGTAYWFDAAISATAGTSSITNVTCSINEI